jgi:succinoglycan biosynthesis protein ExoA
MFVDHGHHAGFLIEAFRAIGGYDPTFSHNEDAEFDLRLTRYGGRIFLDATIRISYAPRSSPQALARQYYNYGKGRARTLIKHSARPRLRQLAPPAVFVGCGAALLLSLVWPPAALLPAAYILLLAVVSVISALRMRSLCGLLAGPASGVMHMCWSAGLLRQMIARRPLRTANSAVP